MRLFKFLYFICLSINIVFAAEDASDLKFARIREIMSSHATRFQDFQDKDLTVLLGNTGSGKSTMINVLAGVPMHVDTAGNLIPEQGKERAKVLAGGVACTKFPELVLDTAVGHLCDLPGFQDTEGVVDDLLNAAFIRDVLTGARSIKALVLTSSEELVADRGPAFKSLCHFMNMFKLPAFRQASCYLLVNRVAPELIRHSQQDTLFKNVFANMDPQDLSLKKLKDSGKVFYIPKTRGGSKRDRDESLRELQTSYDALKGVVHGMQGMHLSKTDLDMSVTFNTQARQDIKAFLDRVLQTLFMHMKEGFYMAEIARIQREAQRHHLDTKPSETLDQNKYAFLDVFKQRFQETQEYAFLHPICGSQFIEAVKRFEPTFYQEHNSAVQMLVIEEQEAARFSAEQTAEEEGKKAVAADQRASEKEQEARDAEAKKRVAEAEAQRKHEEAEKAKFDKNKSEAEKIQLAAEAKQAEVDGEKARQDADRARTECLTAVQTSQELTEQYEQRIRDVQARSEEMQETYRNRAEEMEAEMRERREEGDRERRTLQEEMRSLRTTQTEEKEQLKKQMEDLEKRRARDIQDAEERFKNERMSWEERFDRTKKDDRQEYKFIGKNFRLPVENSGFMTCPVYVGQKDGKYYYISHQEDGAWYSLLPPNAKMDEGE